MPKTFDFSDRTVLVTGGTRGIGAAVAESLLEAGAEVIITGTKAEDVDIHVGKLSKHIGPTIQGWAVDFTNPESLDRCFERLRSLPRLDGLVNNAGTNRLSPIEEIVSEDFDYLSMLNLRTPVLMTREAGRLMKRQRYGRIVNIASIWSVITKPGRAAYSATKSGLVGLTRGTAVDLGPYNVLVNAVSPGFTLTELTRDTLPAKEQKHLAAQVPLRRFAEPLEIATLVLFLVSDLNTYITGQNIVADGGFVCA